ncbi:histidine phosphatase family protein [Candidatus Saccharibacteria bacterium]|nr:histidine phosphatase family protein [Candidatus Saccharibacteria bacterium]
MTTFYICRHGESESNKNGRLMGWLDSPLTDEGVKNAESSANKLAGVAFDKIVSSDLGRAFTTAYIISRKFNYTSEIERYKGLREVAYGDIANMPYSAYPELSPEENAKYAPPNGESLEQMEARAVKCIMDIANQNPDKTILIVTHDGVINAVKSVFKKQNIGTTDQDPHNPHDFVAKFAMDNDQINSFKEVK